MLGEYKQHQSLFVFSHDPHSKGLLNEIFTFFLSMMIYFGRLKGMALEPPPITMKIWFFVG